MFYVPDNDLYLNIVVVFNFPLVYVRSLTFSIHSTFRRARRYSPPAHFRLLMLLCLSSGCLAHGEDAAALPSLAIPSRQPAEILRRHRGDVAGISNGRLIPGVLLRVLPQTGGT